MEAKFFIKGPKKSNQSSNLTSQRMVTESRFMTQLNVSPIPSSRYAEAIFAIGIIKKLQGKTPGGWYSPPWASEG